MNAKEASEYLGKLSKIDKRKLIDKKLFDLTINFTTNDWVNIRTPEFWRNWDAMGDIRSKNRYLLDCVSIYLSKPIPK